jgi:hypothetical protein
MTITTEYTISQNMAKMYNINNMSKVSVIYFRHTAYSICISSNSEGSRKLPDNGRLLPKHVGASILNKGVVQFSA